MICTQTKCYFDLEGQGPNANALNLFDFDNKLLHLSLPLIAPLLAQDLKLLESLQHIKAQEINLTLEIIPISVTATLPKIIEKYVKTQLNSHF